MKIEGIIEDLKIKFFLKLKTYTSKNISRNFSGAVVDSVGSVQFQIVPCSTLYFSMSIDPFQCLVDVNYRVLICCTCTSKVVLSVYFSFFYLLTSLVAQMVKRLSTMWETWVQSPGREDPLEKGMAIHSSTIAWRIPWTEEPDRLQSMGSQRVGHD